MNRKRTLVQLLHMRNYLTIFLAWLFFAAGAQRNIPIQLAPMVDTLRPWDVMQVIHNGVYSKALVTQLCLGNTGAIPYLAPTGMFATDSLFNRDSSTGNTFIGAAINPVQVALFRSGLFSDSTESGAGIFLTDTQTLTPNNLAVVSVTNRAGMGSDSFMVWMAAKSIYQTGSTFTLQRFNGLWADYQDVISSHNSYLNLVSGKAIWGYSDTLGANNLVMDSTGLAFVYNGSNVYHFPVTGGAAMQALTTDGAGNLGWQNAPTGVLPAYPDNPTALGVLGAGKFYVTDGTNGALMGGAKGVVMQTY
jgi:hypothetical protein